MGVELWEWSYGTRSMCPRYAHCVLQRASGERPILGNPPGEDKPWGWSLERGTIWLGVFRLAGRGCRRRCWQVAGTGNRRITGQHVLVDVDSQAGPGRWLNVSVDNAENRLCQVRAKGIDPGDVGFKQNPAWQS